MVLVSLSSALVDWAWFVVVAAALGLSDSCRDGSAGTVFDKSDTPGVKVSFVRVCPSPALTGMVGDCLGGRPLLRFGERGAFPSSLGEVGCEEGVTGSSDSDDLGGVLGGRPLFLFREVAGQLESIEESFPGCVSVFLDWFPPLPLPR